MLRFREKRIQKGLTQEDLAKQLGVSQQTISQYENGTREASYDILKSLSSLYQVPIDYLLGISITYSNADICSNKSLLSSDEQKLIETYRCLNEDEKQVVLGKAIDLKLTGTTTKKKKDIG